MSRGISGMTIVIGRCTGVRSIGTVIGRLRRNGRTIRLTSFAQPVRPDVVGHQRPRICLIPGSDSSESGHAALEVCRLANLGLDPWQELVLVSSLAERADGKWAAFEVGE